MLEVLDAFYGGAAGGGKSIALLTAALLYVHIPRYHAIIIRDTMKNLSQPDSVMDVADQWLSPTDAVWSGDKKCWTFPSGATLSFGYLAEPKDHYNYQSAQFQFIGIDEAVAIRENQAKYMFSRLRRILSHPVPLRFRCASNPPTNEQIARGAWVKNRYVDPITRKKGTVFVPAKMADNKHLDRESYRKSLANLDTITRKQLEDGDWEIKPTGSLFKREWYEIVEVAPVEVVGRIRYWDLAATEPNKNNKKPCFTSGTKMSKTKEGIYYIESVIRFQKEPLYTEKMVKQAADLDHIGVRIWMEQEPGSSGKNTIDHYRREILSGFAFYPDKVTGNKYERAVPLSSQSEAGNVKIVKGAWNDEFLEELELFPDGEYKDQVDSTSGAFNKLNAPREVRIRRI